MGEHEMAARIVFDLDGTLIDSAPDIQNVTANASLAKIDVSAPISSGRNALVALGEGIQSFVEQMRATKLGMYRMKYQKVTA